ncbi:hypothetical protein [Stappia sp. BW2]|nr:hypothetical protein [Stappia sp. BW2]
MSSRAPGHTLVIRLMAATGISDAGAGIFQQRNSSQQHLAQELTQMD